MFVDGKTIRNVLIGLVILALIFLRYFFYWDAKNDCHITILPAITEFSNRNVKRALKTLSYGAPQEYALVCQNVKTISPNLGCGGFGGGCYYEAEPNTIYISTSQNDLIGTAAIIVHETCHTMQAAAARPLDETECYQADDKVFRDLAVYK